MLPVDGFLVCWCPDVTHKISTTDNTLLTTAQLSSQEISKYYSINIVVVVVVVVSVEGRTIPN